MQAAVAAELARGEREYAFVTHIGDISYSGLEAQGNATRDTQLWDLFMDEIAPISSAASYLVAPGALWGDAEAVVREGGPHHD